jgi:hypothetical protein
VAPLVYYAAATAKHRRRAHFVQRLHVEQLPSDQRSGTRNIRALLILAGRALPGQSRPSNDLANYVENQNADGGTLFEQRPVRRVTMAANANAPWNDRIVIVDWNSPLQEPAQVIDDNIPAVPVRVASLP